MRIQTPFPRCQFSWALFTYFLWIAVCQVCTCVVQGAVRIHGHSVFGIFLCLSLPWSLHSLLQPQVSLHRFSGVLIKKDIRFSISTPPLPASPQLLWAPRRNVRTYFVQLPFSECASPKGPYLCSPSELLVISNWYLFIYRHVCLLRSYSVATGSRKPQWDLL
jgi:hypothetical protein